MRGEIADLAISIDEARLSAPAFPNRTSFMDWSSHVVG